MSNKRLVWYCSLCLSFLPTEGRKTEIRTAQQATTTAYDLGRLLGLPTVGLRLDAKCTSSMLINYTVKVTGHGMERRNCPRPAWEREGPGSG
jgi:hypothetical protein